MKTEPVQLPPSTILYAGEIETARLNDGTEVKVRVVIVPVRHRLEMFNLFETSKKADVLERSVQINHGTEEKTNWQPVTKDWVDSLDDASTKKLFKLSELLNFQNAIDEAEDVIAVGNKLLPMQQRFAATAMKPIKDEITSWMSSLTSQFTAALAEKKP